MRNAFRGLVDGFRRWASEDLLWQVAIYGVILLMLIGALGGALTETSACHG